MSTPDFTIDRAYELINRIIKDDDGAHVEDVWALVCGIADPKSVVAMEVEKRLYSLTPDFEEHFKAKRDKLKVA